MLFTLLLPLAVAPSPSPLPAPRAAADPPIRVSLDHDGQYLRGDRARVDIRAARDGYVVVLRADAAGRVRVLFPLDPGDDAFIRGGRTFEVRGRSDREAFFVDEEEGSGLILAAWSPDALRFDEFVRGDHWDYRSLGAGAVADDPEAGLLEIVRRMVGEARFEFDVVPYFIAAFGDHPYRSYGGYGCPGCGSWYGPGWGVSISFGFGWAYPYYYRPFFYSPFYYGPAFYYPLGPYCFWPCNPYGYPYYGLGYRPYGYGYGAHRPFVPHTTVFGRPADPGPRFEPRQRGPTTLRGRSDLGTSLVPRRATDPRAVVRSGATAPRGLRETARGVSGVDRRAAERAGSRSFRSGDGARGLAPRSPAAGRGWSGVGGRAAPRGRVGASPGMTRGGAGTRVAPRGRR